MLYANLLNSRAVELNDMTIGIEFSSGLNDFRKQLLEKNENIREVERLVSIACGKEMQIKYIEEPAGKIETPKTNTKPKQVAKAPKENKVNSLEDLEDLGLNINYIDE